jgi:hypothetical protein
VRRSQPATTLFTFEERTHLVGGRPIGRPTDRWQQTGIRNGLLDSALPNSIVCLVNPEKIADNIQHSNV